MLTEEAAEMVLGRLDRWHLRRAQPGPLLIAAWRFRHNMTMADAVYVALAAELGGRCSPTITGSSTRLASRRT